MYILTTRPTKTNAQLGRGEKTDKNASVQEAVVYITQVYLFIHYYYYEQ